MCMFQQQVEYKSFFFSFLCTCRCWEGLFCNADPHLHPVWLPSLLYVLLRLPQQQGKTLLSRGNFLLCHQTTGMKLGKKPQDKTKNTKVGKWMDEFSLPDDWWAGLQVQWLRCRKNVGKSCLGVAVESHGFNEINCIKLQSNISPQFPRIHFLCCFKGA